MSDAPLMIGVSGLRGIVGQSLTPDVASRFAAAFGSWLVERRGTGDASVAIGRDGRAGGLEIHEAAIAGLRSVRCKVHDLGVATTPTVGFACDSIATDGGMIVTASHNPQQWNGLKCLVRGSAEGESINAHAPFESDARSIINSFERSADASAFELRADRTTDTGSDSAHVDAVCSAIGKLSALTAGLRTGPGSGLTVALDSLNASGAKPGSKLLMNLGSSDVVHINADDSGIFPHTPEPLRENLTGLCDAVRESGADIGFAQDPDADRLAIVDDNGHYIGEEYTLVLAAMALLNTQLAGNSAGQPIICTNLSTSRMIDDVAAQYGVRVVRTPVGEANVVQAMVREQAAGGHVILGGEGNGGIIWPAITYVRDSISSMALTLALMTCTGKRISELVAQIPSYAIQKQKTPIASKSDAIPSCDAIARHWANARIDRQDGVRVDLEDDRAWLHVRASNTEPILRLIAESPTPEDSARLLEEAQKAIRAG